MEYPCSKNKLGLKKPKPGVFGSGENRVVVCRRSWCDHFIVHEKRIERKPGGSSTIKMEKEKVTKKIEREHSEQTKCKIRRR